MTKTFAAKLRAQGVTLSAARSWPIEWVVMRLQPEAHWPAVRGEDALSDEPLIICSDCYTILDGWHRLAKAWQDHKRYVDIIFADTHFYGEDHCRPDLGAWVNESIRPWAEMSSITTCYHKSDLEIPRFAALYKELQEFGGSPPNTPLRLWERTRCVIFAGCLIRKAVLDVGTRESLVPHYLAQRPGGVERMVALDINSRSIQPDPAVEIWQADARDLPFDTGTFDFVMSTSCVNLIPGHGDTKAVQEMVRVTKPGGLITVSCALGRRFEDYPSKMSLRRIYDKLAVYKRLIDPVRSQATLCGPVDLDRSDWSDWVGARLEENLQACVVVLRKHVEC